MKIIAFGTPAHPFNMVEVHPCKEYNTGTDEAYIEQVEESEAEFWSVYVRYIPNEKKNIGGLECISDHDTKEDAEEFATLIRTLIKFGKETKP